MKKLSLLNIVNEEGRKARRQGRVKVPANPPQSQNAGTSVTKNVGDLERYENRGQVWQPPAEAVDGQQGGRVDEHKALLALKKRFGFTDEELHYFLKP